MGFSNETQIESFVRHLMSVINKQNHRKSLKEVSGFRKRIRQ